MKKLALTFACTLAVAGAAFAQGTVSWTGPSAASVTIQTNSTQYSPLFGGGASGSGSTGFALGSTTTGNGYYFELLYTAYTGSQAAQPSTLSQLAGWSDAGLGGTNNSGNTAGHLVVVNSQTAATVPWASGTTDSVMLVFWSQNLGTSWANALATLQSSSALSAIVGNAFLGESQTGFISPNPGNPGATVFANSPVANTGTPIGNSLSTQLYLVPVPEPSTIAMAAFGGLSLLALRRKK